MRKLLFSACVFVSACLLLGCASAPKSYTRGKFDRPQKVLINLSSDGQNWREDWRMAFMNHGYDVVFQDEALISNRTIKTEKMDIEKKNVIDDKDILYEFRLGYIGAWDVVWYVENVSLSVRDLKSGQVLGSYRDDNFWAHPSVPAVVNKIETIFLSTLWKN